MGPIDIRESIGGVNRPRLLGLAAFIAVATVHFLTVPRTIWEYDENLFALGVEKYEPLAHHPPPPGYPIYMACAKLVALFTGGDAFRALVILSIITLAAGLLTWFLAFREITGDAMIGIVASALLYLCPALLISGVLPQSDSGALALFGLAAYACARRNPQFAAIACAACIGWRQQFAVAVVPMFLVALFLLKDWRERGRAVGIFAATCVLWLLPMIVATDGPQGFFRLIFGQAAYYAAHDAALSRSGYSSGLLLSRFLAHPWGPKYLAFPLLLIAVAGAVMLLVRRNKLMWPLAIGCGIYFVFALLTMDPADAVRYAIPALPVIALFAAVPLIKLALIGLMIAIAYAAGTIGYTMPVLRARATSDAPSVAAAKWMQTNVPKETLVLYDLPLRPHADYLLRQWKSMRIDAGLAKFGGDPNVPMVILADGARGNSPGVTFSWPDTDAYRKLTRQHYGAVSVIPLPPSGRYHVIEGISSPERTRSGESWRWIGKRGVLELPDLGASQVRLRFHAPGDYPLGENRIRVHVSNREFTTTIKKGANAELTIPIPRGVVRITIEADQSFVPAQVEGALNRDQRTLSVMLTGVQQM